MLHLQPAHRHKHPTVLPYLFMLLRWPYTLGGFLVTFPVVWAPGDFFCVCFVLVLRFWSSTSIQCTATVCILMLVMTRFKTYWPSCLYLGLQNLSLEITLYGILLQPVWPYLICPQSRCGERRSSVI